MCSLSIVTFSLAESVFNLTFMSILNLRSLALALLKTVSTILELLLLLCLGFQYYSVST